MMGYGTAWKLYQERTRQLASLVDVLGGAIDGADSARAHSCVGFAASTGDPEAVSSAVQAVLSPLETGVHPAVGSVSGELQDSVAQWQSSWHCYQQARAEACQRHYTALTEQEAHSEV